MFPATELKDWVPIPWLGKKLIVQWDTREMCTCFDRFKWGGVEIWQHGGERSLIYYKHKVAHAWGDQAQQSLQVMWWRASRVVVTQVYLALRLS